MSNPCLDAVETELNAVGIPYRVDHGGKHLRIMFGADYQHLHVVAQTPSDHRAPMNERALIRRSLAQLGYRQEDEAPPSVALVSLTDGNSTCASYHVAEHFSKAHKDVLRAIDNVRQECGPEFDRRNFTPIDYLDSKGRTYRAFRMTRDGFTLVVMGFTGRAAMEWKVKYIDAFNSMEREMRALSPAAEILSIRSELDAVVGLLGDLEAKQAIPFRQKKPPFVRPSIIRKMRRRA